VKKLFESRLLSVALATAVALLDQFSKFQVVHQLGQNKEFVLIPCWVNLRLVWNNGAAFSLFPQGASWLGLISFVVSLALLYCLWRGGRKWTTLQLLAAGLLLGGTLGNGIDRWRLGAVVDFIKLVPISFPVFNFADIAINLAVISLLIANLRAKQ
jgi:signal peptidase II